MKIEIIWNIIKLVALVFSSFELFSIITNNNKKTSIAGTIVLAFSGCILWNLNKIDAVILGEIITVLIYKIINENKIKKIIPISVAIVFFSIIYMYTFRPFAISFGYLFLALILWIIAKNFNILKENKKKILILFFIVVLSIIGASCAEIFFAKPYNDYIDTNTTLGISGLFTYLYTPLLPFNDITDPGLWASIFSLFPIPMVIALYFMYKQEKHSEFLLPIVIVTVFESVYCISGFPNIISKFTMLSSVSPMRVIPAVQLANIFILFYFLENIKDSLFSIKYAIRITIITICILAFIKYPTIFSSKGYLYLFAIEMSLLIFMFLNYSDKNYKKMFLILLCLISLIGGIPAIFLA